jgi:integrase
MNPHEENYNRPGGRNLSRIKNPLRIRRSQHGGCCQEAARRLSEVRKEKQKITRMETGPEAAGTATGIRPRAMHDLRHSFASLHLNNGTPIAFISEWLGHIQALS